MENTGYWTRSYIFGNAGAVLPGLMLIHSGLYASKVGYPESMFPDGFDQELLAAALMDDGHFLMKIGFMSINAIFFFRLFGALAFHETDKAIKEGN